MDSLLGLLVPLGVLILAGAWLSRYQLRSYGKHVAQVEAINNELLTLNRDMVAELREIKAILKDRK